MTERFQVRSRELLCEHTRTSAGCATREPHVIRRAMRVDDTQWIAQQLLRNALDYQRSAYHRIPATNRYRSGSDLRRATVCHAGEDWCSSRNLGQLSGGFACLANLHARENNFREEPSFQSKRIENLQRPLHAEQ